MFETIREFQTISKNPVKRGMAKHNNPDQLYCFIREKDPCEIYDDGQSFMMKYIVGYRSNSSIDNIA